MTFQNNTLRLNLTYPDTYNLVGFSGYLHLWWISLLTPKLLTPKLCVTSVIMNQFPRTPELLTPELCVTSVIMNQFPRTQG